MLICSSEYCVTINQSAKELETDEKVIFEGSLMQLTQLK